MMPFIFTSEIEQMRCDSVLLAEVPEGLLEKQSLLAWYAKSLRFPDYFGGNWDALDECLRDLSWIKDGRVVIYHRDVPLEGVRGDQEIYIDLLASVVKSWREGGAHEIIVVFNPGCEGALRAINGSWS